MQLLLNALAAALAPAEDSFVDGFRYALRGKEKLSPQTLARASNGRAWSEGYDAAKRTIESNVPAIPTAPLPPFSAEELATILLGLSVLQRIDRTQVSSLGDSLLIASLFNDVDNELLSAHALSADEIDALRKRLTTEG